MRKQFALCLIGSAVALMSARQSLGSVIAHWTFNDASGSTTAADSSGSGNTATAANASQVTFGGAGPSGGFGTSVALNGAAGSDFTTNLGANTITQSAAGYTISAWVNPTSSSSTTINTIFGSWSNPWAMRFWVQNGQIGIQERNSSAADAFNKFYGTSAVNGVGGSVPAGTWTQVAVTYDRTNGLLEGYVNGVNVFSNSVAAFTPMSSSNKLSIGIKQDSNQTFNGSLNNLWVTDAPLSDAEVSSLYTSNAVPEPATFSILALAGAGLLARRRTRSV